MQNTLIPGSTSVSIEVFIQNTSGAALTGLVHNSAGLRAFYRRSGNAAATAITLATLASSTAAFSAGGFIEIDATNMPGLYRLDLPNAAIDVGADWVNLVLSGASGMTAVPVRYALRASPSSVRCHRAQAGAAGTITLDTGASTTDDLFNRNRVTIVAGTGRGQSRYITDYVGSTRVASVSPNWVTNPDSTSVFDIDTYGLDAADLATVVSAIWDKARSAHTLADTFGAMFQALNDGTAQAGAAGSITLAAGASSVDGFYNGAVVQIISGTGAGQARPIASYVGSTRVATVQGSWVTAPNNTSRYLVVPGTGFAELSAATIDAILDEPIPDPTGLPAAFTPRNVLGWLAGFGFRQLQTATTATLRNRADTADRSTRGVSDDGTTGTFGRWT